MSIAIHPKNGTTFRRAQDMSVDPEKRAFAVLAKRGRGYCVAEPRAEGAQVAQVLDGCTAQLGVAWPRNPWMKWMNLGKSWEKPW